MAATAAEVEPARSELNDGIEDSPADDDRTVSRAGKRGSAGESSVPSLVTRYREKDDLARLPMASTAAAAS